MQLNLPGTYVNAPLPYLLHTHCIEILLDDLWLHHSVLTNWPEQLIDSLSSAIHDYFSLQPTDIPTPTPRSAACSNTVQSSVPRRSEDVRLYSRPICGKALLGNDGPTQIASANETSRRAFRSDGSTAFDAAGPRSETCQLPSNERQWAEKVFHVFDENQEGKVCQRRLGSLLRKLGLEISPENVDSLIASVNVKVAGYLDIDEFFLLYSTCLETFSESENTEEKDLFDTFLVFDKNRDGYISCDELQEVLSTLGFEEGENAKMCQDMLDRVDEDGNGKVDFTEFKKMMTRRYSKT